MADLMRLFPRVLIICGGFECARHAGGYWPQDVQARIRLVRFEPVNRRLAAELGQGLSAELGIGPALAGAPPPRLGAVWQTAQQKRLLPLAAHLHAVALAAEEGASRVMILESDLKPLVANRLPPAQLAELSHTLRTRRWQILRPTGYHRAFTSSRTKQRNGSCTAACACTVISPALPRACEVKAGAAWRLTSPTPLASHTPAAAHTRQRPPVAPGAASAAGSCLVPDYSAADTVISGAASADAAGAGSAYCEVNDNDMYGVHSEAYPVFVQQQACLYADLRSIGKAAPGLTSRELERRFASLERSTLQFVDRWIPARFNTVFIAPQVAVQQIKQSSGATDASARFGRLCMRGPGRV